MTSDPVSIASCALRATYATLAAIGTVLPLTQFAPCLVNEHG